MVIKIAKKIVKTQKMALVSIRNDDGALMKIRK